MIWRGRVDDNRRSLLKWTIIYTVFIRHFKVNASFCLESRFWKTRVAHTFNSPISMGRGKTPVFTHWPGKWHCDFYARVSGNFSCPSEIRAGTGYGDRNTDGRHAGPRRASGQQTYKMIPGLNFISVPEGSHGYPADRPTLVKQKCTFSRSRLTAVTFVLTLSARNPQSTRWREFRCWIRYTRTTCWKSQQKKAF